MEKVSQPSAWPTRKLFYTALAALATGVAIQLGDDAVAQWPVAGPYVDQLKTFAPIGIGVGIGWIMKDRGAS